MKLRVLITVKTYPIPSAKYDELVCTAGVLADGTFVRLYPVPFRDLDFEKQYAKYEWIEVYAEKHRGRDVRKESYRPDCDTLIATGERISTDGDPHWHRRGQYVLAKQSKSIEELWDQQKRDRTSLGLVRPKCVRGLVVEEDAREWKPEFLAALKQARLFETRKNTREPPRKVPWKFRYQFECDDPRCNGHTMMIEDWEVGALYWRLIDGGNSEEEAIAGVRAKFLDELCAPDRDPHFFVGTTLKYPKSWLIIGVYWPRRSPPTLFPM